MVNSDDWGVHDLVGYLVRVRATLKPTDIKELQETPAFPQEVLRKGGDRVTVGRRKLTELYEPTDALRELDLPLLDWGGHKWTAASKEGMRRNSNELHAS